MGGPGGPGIPLHRPAGYKFFDSLGMDECGDICFGGDGMLDAYVCLSGNGKLMTMRCNRPGLKLNC